MNSLTRKFYTSTLSIIFVITLLGTVTYAWFSLASTNVLDSLSLNITAGEELLISIDGVNFYKEITTSMVREKINKDLKLKDVTSNDGVNFKLGGPRGISTPIKNQDYLSLTFWFKTASAYRSIYLIDNVSNIAKYDEGKDGTYVVSRGITWKADNTFLNGENEFVYTGDKDVYYAADAVRISFVEEKLEDNPNDTRSEELLSRKIFDLSGDNSRGYGTEFGGLDYYNVKHNTTITPPTSMPNTTYELTQFDEFNPYMPLDDNSLILELIKTNTINENERSIYMGKLTVNIWIEGWDADCFNAIYSDSVKVQLRFKAGLPKQTSVWMNN